MKKVFKIISVLLIQVMLMGQAVWTYPGKDFCFAGDILSPSLKLSNNTVQFLFIGINKFRSQIDE